MKNKSVMLAIVALVIVVGVVGAIALTGNKKSDDASSMVGSMSTMNSDNKTTSGSSSDAVATTSVKIQSYAYTPQVIKVKVGDKVTWTNNDSVQHTVTADKASSDAPDSELIAQGETYSFTFTKAGTYAYHCNPHPYMKATVIVE